MTRLSDIYGRLLHGILAAACLLLLAITFLLGLDVLLRNLGVDGIAPSNELSEDGLYLITMLAAPGLLRRGQHIRVDIVLRMIPAKLGWAMEWLRGAAGLIFSLFFIWYGARATAASYFAGSLSIKTLIFPEWWILLPMSICFLLVAVEIGRASCRER